MMPESHITYYLYGLVELKLKIFFFSKKKILKFSKLYEH